MSRDVHGRAPRGDVLDGIRVAVHKDDLFRMDGADEPLEFAESGVCAEIKFFPRAVHTGLPAVDEHQSLFLEHSSVRMLALIAGEEERVARIIEAFQVFHDRSAGEHAGCRDEDALFFHRSDAVAP